MRRFVFLFFLLPLAAVLVALSVANRGTIDLALDPFGWASLTAPLYMVLFAAFAAGCVIGGTAAWFRQGRWRAAARTEKARADRLQQEVERLDRKAQNASQVSLLPPGQGRNAA